MSRSDGTLTTVQISKETRDRLYRLKFRRTYDEFLQELCDLYENGRVERPETALPGDSR